MGGCFGSGPTPKDSIGSFEKTTRVEQIDFIKGKLKGSRDKIDHLISQHEKQVTYLNQQIQKQKDTGLKNKAKAVYLLKQRKDFQEQINNLNTRKQAVIKTLNNLSQQQMDQQMVTVLEQSNQYMRKVQEQLQRKNWRQILSQAQNNKYNPIQFRQASEDPQVNALYAQLQQQVFNQKTPKVVNIPQMSSKTINPTTISRKLEYN